MATKQVVIMVGVPGCGKSTWVKNFIEHCPPHFSPVVCSADDEHLVDVDLGGEFIKQYKFEPSKAPMAHSNCMNKFLRAIADPAVTHVVVDNTNVSQWERQNYEQAARYVGADVSYQVWNCETIAQVKLCASRNVHGVPVGFIADMALRFEMPNYDSKRIHPIQ